MAIGFAVWSILTAATALTTGYASLFVVRLLLGVGEAVVHPACMRWIRFNFPERKRGLAIGVLMSGSKFGPAIGTVLAAMLIENFGWQMMFVLVGLASLLWLIPFSFMMKNDRGVRPSAIASTAFVNSVPMSKLLANPIIWGTVIGTFCYMYFVYFCLTWMPAYYTEEMGLTLGSSSE